MLTNATLPATQWQTFDLLCCKLQPLKMGSCLVCWQGTQSMLSDIVHRLFTATSPQQFVQNEIMTAD